MTDITISVKQTEFYSSTFSIEDVAEQLGCEPTEEAIGQALSELDPFDYPFSGDVLNNWDMAENSEWSIL